MQLTHNLLLLAVFLVSPSSYNASEGSNVTFYCHINETGNILFWLVNDEFSHSTVNQNRSISLIKYSNEHSTLTILAHSWNDHVEIQCVYRSLQSRSLNCSNEMVMCSAKAILRVQGHQQNNIIMFRMLSRMLDFCLSLLILLFMKIKSIDLQQFTRQ